MCIWLLGGGGRCCHFCLIVYIILVRVLFVCFFVFSTKQISTKAWKRVYSLSSRYALGISKKAFGAFGVLTSKVNCVQILWHLNEAVWLQDQRAPFGFPNQDHIWESERALFLWCTHSSPQVRLYCADMQGGRHGASKEMYSKLVLSPIHCGTFTELASLFRSAFSA